MKLITPILIASLLLTGSALAQTVEVPKASVATATKAQKTTAAKAPADENVWTEDQIKAVCLSRASREPGSANAYQRCIDRNTRKVGQQKMAGEVIETKNAEEAIKKKAEERAAEKEAEATK